MRLTPKQCNESGREYALRTIKDNIISLELAPGSSISENELAAEMGLSRTPVREALIDLGKVKIIETAPQKKSTVAYIDYKLVEEARFIRNVLECAVIQIVCDLRTDEDLDRLRENLKFLQFHLDNMAFAGVMELDDQFHRELFRIAHKPLAFQMIQNISIHFDRVRNMSLTSVKDIKIAQDHRALVDALSQRNPELARTLMDKHLNRYKLDEQDIRTAYPQFFRDPYAARKQPYA